MNHVQTIFTPSYLYCALVNNAMYRVETNILIVWAFSDIHIPIVNFSSYTNFKWPSNIWIV